MTKVTVVIPIYNADKYLDKCLNSIVNQTFKDIEIIAINDNSTDNTLSILNNYQEKYPYITIINNSKNYGIGYNRNLGIKNAKGDYILFIDSDDYLESDMIEKVYNKLTTDNSDMAIFNYNKIVSGNKISNQINIEKYSTTSLMDSPELLMDVNFSPWNKMYKKGLLKDNSFPENLKYEDAIFVLKTITRSKKISFINENLYNYLVHDKSETTVMDNRVFDILEITKMMVKELKDQTYYEKISIYAEAYITTNLFRYTIQQKYQKDYHIAKKFINEVFDYLNKEFPNWKKNKIWKKRNSFKRFIEANKTLSKIYCFIAR